MSYGIRRAAALALMIGLVLTAAACGGGKATKKSEPQQDLATQVGNLVREAQSLVNAGRLPDAMTVLDKATEIDPQNASVYSYYGQVALIAGRHAEAEEALGKALAADPYLTDAYNTLGLVHHEQGNNDQAIEAFQKALADRAYPTPEKVYLNLGIVFSSQGRAQEAVDAFRKAVEIDPKYYDAHYELASVLDRTNRLEEAAREYEVARPGYAEGQKVAAMRAEYHLRFGTALLRLSRQSQAREELRRVCDIAPGSPACAQSDTLIEGLH